MSEPFDISIDADHARVARVVWIDSGVAVHNGWLSPQTVLGDHMKVSEVQTLGFWVGETDDVVALAQTMDENGDLLNVQVILKSCIIRKEWL